MAGKATVSGVGRIAPNKAGTVGQIDSVQVLAALKDLKNGDFTVRLPPGQGGIAGEIAEAFNAVVERIGHSTIELDQLGTLVGKEGRINHRVGAGEVSGGWALRNDAVNELVTDLVQPIVEVARVIGAVAKGDLSQTMALEIDGRPLEGEFLRIGNTVNTMVHQLGSFASEVTRVAREVGTDGKLGGQADVNGAAGTWKDLTDNVNMMAANLTGQVRNIAEVTTAVANGDLSKKITVDVRGEILELKNTINTMVDQLSSFASEVTRVAREVGTEGKLGGQAVVKGVAGTWKDLTDNVNFMASNLTGQVRNIAEVTTAVARGDLSKKITVDVQGEILELKDTINTMVDQLSSFASEVTRVAREVGTDGRLGGQAEVKDVSGTWRDLTDSVNSMAANLTGQVRNIAEVTTAVANGDLSKKITVNVRGEILELKATINTMVDQLSSFASEVTRVAHEVGTEGNLGGQAVVKGVAGTWKDLTDNVNFMASNLTGQVRNIAEVTTAVASGDLSKKITVDVRGEILELKNTINTMVDQLGSFASEVTRVAREVGTEGRLGGQADVQDVSGTWRDLTDSVNSMAANLTGQVRNIAQVTTAVAKGDLSKKITVSVRGEIQELKDTINTMVDQLSSFASEVTRVAREVGTEGRLGGQADVQDVSGTWRDLTDSVNSMAANLTGQVRNIAEVTTAVANGDLSKKITVESKGEILLLKDAINKMVNYLNQLANEVGRVTRAAGEEGKLTELTSRALVAGATGAWKNIVDTLNFLLDSIAMPVTEIGRLVTAISQGDLSQKMPFGWKNDLAVARGDALQKMEIRAAGDIKTMAETINNMVDNLNTFAGEVTRVAREVGTEGQLGGQAHVPGVAGTWKDLTDSVNSMAAGLTAQVRDIANVATAVANGDLSQKITVKVKGEILDLKETINKMVDNLNTFSGEVTRVAREVGTEGKLGGQADVKGVAGVWKDLTANVNSMASNLTAQVRNIAEVTTAVANGDLSRKITVDVRGEILELKNTINIMVDQLRSFAAEVTRVAREVGTEGKLGGQAEVQGVAGVWKDLTDNVNWMAGNLTAQVRNIAGVTTAVANGDLSKKITVDVKGEILELKDTINTMVDQLSSFASEVTRVAREVGTEGRLGGQAHVKGVAGTWKDLTDNVNMMAANLTGQVRNIAEVTTAVATGDLSKKITVDVRGEILELKNTINTMVDQLSSFASEVTRVAREVGTEGKLGGQAVVKGVAGTWKDLTDNVNMMADNLTTQVRNIADVTTAVARGDLSTKITVDVKGEILELKKTINTMVDQLSSFASEVTRVAREVGTEGKLGGQADVKGVAGTWKDLTDNVNLMADNLTTQVRGIARVVTAVANGDLTRRLTVESKGEIAALTDTINEMNDTLATFAEQVTTVAREVGVEGKLGGQASVPGAAGTWRDLTDNVNRLAANLTTQVRAIAEVATAVTKGDLTRSITVVALGEVAVLKDNINEMIRNLRDTTQKNTEQDWLKTNLAAFTRMLQGQKDLATVAKLILSELAPVVSAQHGAFYLMESTDRTPVLSLLSAYAYRARKNLSNQFRLGEGIVGQCALEREPILLTEVPDDYIRINSGLGEAPPRNIIVLPVLFEGQVKAVVELGSLNLFSEIHLTFLQQLAEGIGIVLNTLAASMRTEELLRQSQTLAEELQSQQQELRNTNVRLEEQAASLRESEELLKKQREQLQQSNEELEEKAQLLSGQKAEVETKNKEIELARRALQEKAEQLELTSKYKSEFLANMSHELRTPLNSLLLLAELLANNEGGNLVPKQVEAARGIFSSGSDLLTLINDILDMSKIESGVVAVEISEVPFVEVRDAVDQTFRQVAQERELDFSIKLSPGLPPTISTDRTRLHQVLKNLLSNAFKFTKEGQVALEIDVARYGWSTDNDMLNSASTVIAFSVTDTGVGIAADKLQIIFEPFHQADMSTSRRYGGTGLGLSISREIAHMLGGEIRAASTPGRGSTFTFYLPQSFVPRRTAPEHRLASEIDKPPQTKPPPLVPEVSASSFLPRELHDDRNTIQPTDRVILIVEDDVHFARILLEMAHERGFKALLSLEGDAGLALARKFQPESIILDIQLPDTKGWTVLDRLKHDPAMRHIPVHIISINDEMRRGSKLGAFACLRKPVTREALSQAFSNTSAFLDRAVKDLLVVAKDEIDRQAILELIGDGDVHTTAVAAASEALVAMKTRRFDCMVIDLPLPDMDGIELVETIRREPDFGNVPIVVYAATDLADDEEARLDAIAQSVIIKDGTSPQRLLDQTALFLHRVEANLPDSKKRMLQQIHETDFVLSGKTVLIVDDDPRNVYALTAILEHHKMQVLYAENGPEGIELLKRTPKIDLVLMDIMMPGMDGYETMRAIRQIDRFKSLPIIALTAKAMKGDREKCIQASASDYIAKPVNTEQLLSLLRVWLYH